MSDKAKLCRHFARGKCKFGDRCRFSHDASSENTERPSSDRLTEPSYKSLAHWRSMAPKSGAASRPLPFNRLSEFFSTGSDLVSTDEGVRQEVIKHLASESGLTRIKELVNIIKQDNNDARRREILEKCLGPFYRILANRGVLDSLLLEQPLETILNFVFGPGGQRGIELFNFTTKAIESQQNSSQSMEVDDNLRREVEGFLGVFAKTIELNGTANIMPEFSSILDALVAIFVDADLFDISGNPRSCLRKAQRLLSIGEQVPEFQNIRKHHQGKPTFEIAVDGPGWLSADGKRHDNDHDDITKIKILPTAHEIQSPRPEYLPPNDLFKLHLLGPEGLLDRQFRLLREDTVGQVRDAVRNELQRRLNEPKHLSKETTRQGARTIAYHNGVIKDINARKNKGLQIIYEFDQPPPCSQLDLAKRKQWWSRSKRLQIGSLVCLLDKSGSPLFCSTSAEAPQSSKNDSQSAAVLADACLNGLSKDADRSAVHLTLVEVDEQSTLEVLRRYGRGWPETLVEFPGILLAAFAPTLKALQRMTQRQTMAFDNILAPQTKPLDAQIEIDPPEYALQRGFAFDLSPLTRDGGTLELVAGQRFDLKRLTDSTTLDEAQARALIAALTRRIALIQGPPGTGKSYTGVAILKVLIENQTRGDLGPVICVCYTNHALDQLLEHLVGAGMEQIIRIGSRSKSTLLEGVNLHTIAWNMEGTKAEKRRRWELSRQSEGEIEQLNELLEDLNRVGSKDMISQYLLLNSVNWHAELFADTDDEGYRVVQYYPENVVTDWLRGKNLRQQHSERMTRDLKQLQDISLFSMSKEERHKVYYSWISDIRRELNEKIADLSTTHAKTLEDLLKVKQELHLRALKQANVIGITTSGLARQVDLLGRVGSKVLMCEEAGEILEAHTLTALLPTIEHAIFIGDHLQLRPHTQNYDLSRENPRGKQYSFDVSLFERLVDPQETSGAQLPHSSLEIQRRMHPWISQLIRSTLYPNLRDGGAVANYPEVAGMKSRLFWLDHRKLEANDTEGAFHSSSHTNQFEVAMVAGLVSHLVKQGVYRSEDIAVITPYLGQLQELRKELGKFTEIVVGDRDLEDLDAQGIDHTDVPRTAANTAKKTTLLKSLRIATVDNFQGEEAKVVVISLVRSNKDNRCGFLRTSNRINVLLSRAQHGMYIIGNSETSAHVPMWGEVLSILRSNDCVGESFQLICPRHSDNPAEVADPEQFKLLAPEGGCNLHCAQRLSCGHPCPTKCHSQHLHEAVYCLEECPRSMPGCDHACPKRCGDPCPKQCMVTIFNVPLPCGHVQNLPCFEAQEPATAKCKVTVPRSMDSCGHQVNLYCYEKNEATVMCRAFCGTTLICGHKCSKKCAECKPRDSSGAVTQEDHGKCSQVCGRSYTTCNHRCQELCHGDAQCPLCTAACEVSCQHSKCHKKCHEPCAPCAMPKCASECPHSICCMPCAAPCNWIPCSKRCQNLLVCGHKCPSVCGEACPTEEYCQVCCTEELKKREVDFIMGELYGDIDLNENPCIFPQCGHFRTVQSIDGLMDMSSHYDLDENSIPKHLKESSAPFSVNKLKNCADCRGSLRSVSRYGRIVRRALLDESTKKFILWSNHKYRELEQQVHKFEVEPGPDTVLLAPKHSLFEHQQDLVLDGSSHNQMKRLKCMNVFKTNLKQAFELRSLLVDHLPHVQKEEQPFHRVWELVQNARRANQATAAFDLDETALQTRASTLALTLLLRLDAAILSAALGIWKDMPRRLMGTGIKLDLCANREDCLRVIQAAQSSQYLAQVVEGQILFARYAALELSNASAQDGATLDPLRNQAFELLHDAQSTCTKDKGQCKGFEETIEQVRLMLKGGDFYTTVTSEERRSVLAAMATEFSGTGHWYYCQNGHPFTVGECGGPMQNATCPYCGAPIGGQHHIAAEGVTRATDLDEEIARLQL